MTWALMASNLFLETIGVCDNVDGRYIYHVTVGPSPGTCKFEDCYATNQSKGWETEQWLTSLPHAPKAQGSSRVQPQKLRPKSLKKRKLEKSPKTLFLRLLINGKVLHFHIAVCTQMCPIIVAKSAVYRLQQTCTVSFAFSPNSGCWRRAVIYTFSLPFFTSTLSLVLLLKVIDW